MKGIAHLPAMSTESDISQPLARGVRMNPEKKNALLGGSKLTGAGQHAAAIDPNRHAESRTILKRQAFRSEFRPAIERHWCFRRKLFGNPFGADTGGEFFCCGEGLNRVPRPGKPRCQG